MNEADEKLVNYSKHISTPFINGESLQDVEKRMKDFIEMLKEKYSGKNVAIIDLVHILC